MSERSAVTRAVLAIGNAASYLFLVIVAISAYEVLMRYAFDRPTVWVHELSVALAATCFVIGGPYVQATRRHITISFLYEKLPDLARGWARLLCSLLTLAFLLFLTYAACVQGWVAVRQGEMTGTALNWPIPAYLKALFAVCAAIMSLQTLIHIVEDIRSIARRTDPGIEQ
jgi:TRAP-type mannitol/chloroaromatic compound transport system permease small subunit